MDKTKSISCDCGQTRIEVRELPILSVECCCRSCRAAGAKLQSLPGARPILEDTSATRFELYRKDRVRCLSGIGNLREHRLTPGTKTRRIVAACCNSAMYLEFEQGHWLSLYGRRFPKGTLPPLQMRTMTGEMARGSLSDDVPNARTHTMAFYARLFRAWVAMGFRTPTAIEVKERLDG